MIALLVSALAWIVVTAAPAGAQSDAPIRSVVYKVSIQQRNEGSVVHVRKAEVKELPPSKPKDK